LTPDIYTLSLHDALPISIFVTKDVVLIFPWKRFFQGLATPLRFELFDELSHAGHRALRHKDPRAHIPIFGIPASRCSVLQTTVQDRKSTRLNSSHLVISY